MKRLTALILTVLIAAFFTFGMSYAAEDSKSPAPEDSKMKALDKEIRQKQKELEKGKKKEEELFTSLVELEQQIENLEIEIEGGQLELEQLEKDLQAAQKKAAQQNKDLGSRLRSMYKNGFVGFMDVLMNSGSFTDFLTDLDMVQRIYASDTQVLAEMKTACEEIETKKTEIQLLQGDLASAQATAVEEKNEVSRQKAALNKSNQEAEEAIDDLEGEMAVLQKELEEKAKRGDVSSKDSSSYEGGAFLWPTPGNTEITSEFGWRICPFHGKEYHAALDIGAPEGADIVASAAGRVIQSGWYGGFGKSVIIDHGGGLVTQYNHCSETLVPAGEKVKAGQVIAKVGSTGFATGPHLDYRVYVNGEVVDPREYL